MEEKKSLAGVAQKVDTTVGKLVSTADGHVKKYRDSAFNRFPILFSLLASFGLVATFYGFEGLIVQIDFLDKNPLLVLLVGLSTLVLTGTLYKKLG